MSKNTMVTMLGEFTDAAGQTQTELTVTRGQVFYDADNAEQVTVTVIGQDGAETVYTAPHDDTVYASLMKAHASYKAPEFHNV